MIESNKEIKDSMLKTGTSLVSIVCTDGAVLGADRKVTAGNLVVDKNFQKILVINERIMVAMTGSVSDAQFTIKLLGAELRIKEIKNKRLSSVREAANLLAMLTYRGIRQPSMVPSIVGTIVAGVDEDGSAHIYSIEPAGGIIEVKDYDANFSSGMPYILGVLERGYKKDIKVKEGVQLAVECLKASTQRDTASGFGIDIFTFTKEGVKKAVSQEIQSVYK
ncbi:MAG TPA: proteasome subunit beta [Candidatus Nanoarchaeia archaeon]|nr:proteasome subunit beta [Candidatus Nanoarchaeia archaeon]